MPTHPKLESWKDAQPPLSKGCGCLALCAIGLLASAFLMGAMMGDYIGPAEGAAANAHRANIQMLLSLFVIVICGVVGNWLVSKRRK